jgi:hypothetical protein
MVDMAEDNNQQEKKTAADLTRKAINDQELCPRFGVIGSHK